MGMFPVGLKKDKNAPPQYQLWSEVEEADVSKALPPTPLPRCLPTPALRSARARLDHASSPAPTTLCYGPMPPLWAYAAATGVSGGKGGGDEGGGLTGEVGALEGAAARHRKAQPQLPGSPSPEHLPPGACCWCASSVLLRSDIVVRGAV
eukprot:3161904-Rhodomonas_salina.3